MFGIGTGELLLLLLVALLVLGPERMPKLARDIGKTVNDLRRTSDELRSEFLEADKALTAERLLEASTRRSESAAQPQPVPIAPAVAAPAIPPEPDETAFDREARLARERLERNGSGAPVEGRSIPTDEAGTSDRAG